MIDLAFGRSVVVLGGVPLFQQGACPSLYSSAQLSSITFSNVPRYPRCPYALLPTVYNLKQVTSQHERAYLAMSGQCATLSAAFMLGVADLRRRRGALIWVCTPLMGSTCAR